jgi:hypothetical protein
MEILARDKHSSLFCLFGVDDQKDLLHRPQDVFNEVFKLRKDRGLMVTVANVIKKFTAVITSLSVSKS